MARVQLGRVDNVLSGTLGEQRIDLVLDVPHSRAGIRGTSLGIGVDGDWHIQSNYNNLDPVGLFLGEYGGLPVSLRNEVHLTPHYALRHADLTGTIGDQAIRARIASVEAPAYGPSVLGIDGDFDGETISAYVAAHTDMSGISIDGIIGRGVIRLDITHGSVIGEYSGPGSLFLVFACPPLHFL